MSVESTLDAFVQLAVNDEKPFGETEVRWKSSGDAEWNQDLSVDLAHPKSYLVLFVCDDDPVLRKDSMFGYTRNCGFLEIPIWVLPRNEAVSGWFTLTHPDIGDAGDNIADRQAQAKKDKTVKTNKSYTEQPGADAGGGIGEAGGVSIGAGRVRLRLLLETTLEEEIVGHMRPAPSFVQSLPALDTPGFFGDMGEVKRLLVQRLVLRPIFLALHAISWQNPALSSAVLCWHWILCYYPQFIWATIWLLLLLCFWHDIPPQEGEDDGSPVQTTSGVFGGTVAGLNVLASETCAAATGVFTKPLEGMKAGASDGMSQGGLAGIVKGTAMGAAGLVKGTAEGAIGVVSHAGKGVIGFGMNVGDGLLGTLQGLRTPGLDEFQHMLQLMPGLRDNVRRVQRPVTSARKALQKVDDLFYWKDAKLTQKAAGGVAVLLFLSVLLRRYMGVLSGYGWLIVGSLVVVAQASFFNTALKFLLAVVAVATKPKPNAPFVGFDFFQA
jgi:hypothetical protein